MTRIELPAPVPLSACFKNVWVRSKTTGKVVQTRAPTGRYMAWQSEAMKMIMAQKAKPIKGRVSIYVRLVAPDKRHRDAGNTDKSVMDVLVKAGIIEDDSNRFVRRVTFEWRDEGPACLVVVQEHAEEMAA